MSTRADASDPSVRFADTSPSYDEGEENEAHAPLFFLSFFLR